MSARVIKHLPIPYQRYLLSINDLSQGYLMLQGYLILLSEQPGRHAPRGRIGPPQRCSLTLALDAACSRGRTAPGPRMHTAPRPRMRTPPAVSQAPQTMGGDS